MISALVKPIFGISPSYPPGCGPHGVLQQVAGAGLGGAQPGFEFATGQFNGVEIGRIRRQVPQPGAVALHHLVQSRHFMDGQISQYDHVAWSRGRAQHLVKVGDEYDPVHGFVHAQERPEPVGVRAAMSVTFGPLCKGTAWSRRRPAGARP